MNAGVLLLSTAVFLLGAQSVSAEVSEGLPLEIKSTRVLIEGKQRQSFWTIKNHAKHSYAFTVLTFDTNSSLQLGDRSKSFIVTPPTGFLNPNEEKTFRIVRVGDDLPTDRESLALLRLKLLPSGQQNQPSQSRIQSLMSIYLKLFYRPESIVKAFAVETGTSQLKASCQDRSITIDNPSPYWMTLDSMNVENQEVITPEEKAPMIAPYAQWSRIVSRCPHSVEIRTIKENGLPTELQALQVEDMK